MAMDQETQSKLPQLQSAKVVADIFEVADEDRNLLNSFLANLKPLDLDNPPEDPEQLLMEDDAPILHAGSIAFIFGRAGTRKTTALTLLAADLIKPDTIENSPFTIKRPLRVLYIDTEQADFDSIVINRRVMQLVGTNEGLKTYSLLGAQPRIIPAVIQELIKKDSPDVCIIDNVADVGSGLIMDIEKAEVTLRNLRSLAVTYHCGILGVLHSNENENSRSPRGHEGSEAVRRSDIVLQIKSEDEALQQYSTVEAIKSRRKRPQKWAVAIDEQGMPYYRVLSDEDLQPAKVSRNPDKYAQIIAKIPAAGCSHTQLTSIITTISNKSKPTADRWIKEMRDAKIITLFESRYYKTGSNTTLQTEIPI